MANLADYWPTEPPEFENPKAPDAKPIIALHRGHDGYLTFHAKPAGADFVDLFSIPAAELENIFPEFLDQLERDSFYSVNGFYRPGRGKSKVSGKLKAPYRSKQGIRWLTACFSDLDFYNNPRLTAGHVIGTVIDYQDKGLIPPASMIVRSGRGIWLFWILANADERYPIGGPVHAWPEAIDAYEQIQRALGNRLAALESDAQARDVSRITRVPGSINGKVGERVSYWIQKDANGNGFAFTLTDLCQRFGITPRKLSKYVRRDCSPEARLRGQKGFRGRIAKSIRQFETLRSLRGGFREGTRAASVWLYCSLLRKACPDMSLDEILSEAKQLGAQCLDATGNAPAPLPEKEIRAQWREISDVTNMRNQRIADILIITPDESARLESWPPATKYQRKQLPQEKKATRAEKAERRRAFIAKHVHQSGGAIPTLEAMADQLDGLGMKAAPKTIMRDYRALGFENPRSKSSTNAGEKAQLSLLDFE